VRASLPWLTIIVFAATAITTGAMLLNPAIGDAPERNGPLMLEGQVWRFVTTWLVETDGWQQIAVNFTGLAIFGFLVERFVRRAWWVVAYLGAGLTGEIAGLFWQPVGGGNSVAIAGLIGLFSMWQVRRQDAGLGPVRYLGTAVWLGFGLILCFRHDIHGPALVMGFLLGALAFAKPRAEARHA